MKILLLLLVVTIGFTQKEITLIGDLNDYKKIEKDEFSLSWEIPVISERNRNFGHFNSEDDKYRSISDLVTNPDHTVITIVFRKGKKSIDSWSASGTNALQFKRYAPLYWAGLIPVDQSYEFVKSLIKTDVDREEVYGLLVPHHKNSETLNFFKEELKNADSRRLREKLIFWTGNIESEAAADFLIELFADENYFNLREKLIFAMYVSNTDKAYQFVKQIVISNDSPNDVREKALFWFGQSSRTTLADIQKLMNDLDSERLKEKCIFAISQKDSEEASNYLYNFAQNGQPYRLREKAIFWLANSQKRSLDYLKKLYIGSSDQRIQEKLIFAFYQNGSDEAIDFMIKLMKSDITATHVKKKIIFWLGQSRSQKAIGAISDILD